MHNYVQHSAVNNSLGGARHRNEARGPVRFVCSDVGRAQDYRIWPRGSSVATCGAWGLRAQIGAFGPIWAHVRRALWGRVLDGLRLLSRFQLHAGRREAQERDGSLR